MRMRIEPFGVGSLVHVTNRGTRGANIVCDDADKERFVRSLFHLNDTHADSYWHREIARISPFERPSHWPEREPLVRILAWTLLPNHFHILFEEIVESGVTRFMQRLGGSMTMCFNQKYREKGSLFQGSYHARVVNETAHLNYLAFYILVKNTLEMYPGGLTAALTHFDDAWEWAKKYQFSSLRDYALSTPSPIIDDAQNLLGAIIDPLDVFKDESRDLLVLHMDSKGDDFANLMLEAW